MARRFALVAMAVALGGATGVGAIAPAVDSDPRPNFVVILVDDLEARGFELGFHRRLPEPSALERDLIEAGATFENFFYPTALCCPSRASFLTGQYPHNHLVYGNNPFYDDDRNGGLYRFFVEGRDATSLGAWLQAAGYRTGFIGKYLNGYPDLQGLDVLGVDESYVPAGWDEWHGTFTQDKPRRGDPIDFSYEHFRMNHDGDVVVYGPGAYLTHVEAGLAVDFIERSAATPFLLFLSVYAPHAPTTPAPEDLGRHAAAGVVSETRPSCDEEDLSDKPAWLRDAPALDSHGLCRVGGLSLDLTLAVDDLIGEVIGELDRLALLDETYVFFASDNGRVLGEHHIGGKSSPYDESLRVPMVLRGPGIPAGVTRDHFAMNIDIAPTILDLAGATPTAGSPPPDGESLVGPATGATQPGAWRDAVLFERLKAPLPDNVASRQPYRVPRFQGVRTAQHQLTEYETGELELYDMVEDPYQLDSMHDEAPPELLERLYALLGPLSTCGGEGCATAARTPWVGVASLRLLERPGGELLPRAVIEDRWSQRMAGATVTGLVKTGSEPLQAQTATANANGVARFPLLDVGPGDLVSFCVVDVSAAGSIFDGAKVCASHRG